MDGDTSFKDECSVFGDGHVLVYDAAMSGHDRSTYSCVCGVQKVEYEDASL